MSGLLIKTEIFGGKEFISKLGEISSLVSNLDVLAESEDELRRILGRCAERTIAKQNYVPVKEKTKKRKIKKYGASTKTLIGTGRMLAELISGRPFELRFNGRRIDIGLSGLGALHQSGAGDLPVRLVIENDEELRSDIAGLLKEKIGEALQDKLKRK